MLAAVAAFSLCPAGAQARHHHRATYAAYADPGCNRLWPCEGVAPSPRGERVVRAMGGFGSARSVYSPQARHRKGPRRRGTAHRRASAKAPPSSPGPARSPPQEASKRPASTPGVVRAATGAVAYVAAGATAAFQCLVSSLEDAGYRIDEMGGFASSGHIRHSKHYAGLALDINQISRGRVSRPFPVNHVAMARACGLTDGGTWANSDLGHFEVPGRTLYASARPRHRIRYASRRVTTPPSGASFASAGVGG